MTDRHGRDNRSNTYRQDYLFEVIGDYFREDFSGWDPIKVGLKDTYRDLCSMLSSDNQDDALAISARGQVAYLSILKTLTVAGRCVYQVRVVPGWLQYEGQRYAWLKSEITGSHFITYNLPIAAEDFLHGPPEQYLSPRSEGH